MDFIIKSDIPILPLCEKNMASTTPAPTNFKSSLAAMATTLKDLNKMRDESRETLHQFDAEFNELGLTLIKDIRLSFQQELKTYVAIVLDDTLGDDVIYVKPYKA